MVVLGGGLFLMSEVPLHLVSLCTLSSRRGHEGLLADPRRGCMVCTPANLKIGWQVCKAGARVDGSKPGEGMGVSWPRKELIV